MRNPKNSEDTLKVYLGYELEKFYNHAFVDGQLNVLEQGDKR
jgi:hypothetical protein